MAEPVVTLWQATCGDCGFVSGMARVRFPDGTGAMLTGAGCRSRRGPKVSGSLAAANRARISASRSPTGHLPRGHDGRRPLLDDLAYLLAEADRLADYARAADEAVGVVSAERDEARGEALEAGRTVGALVAERNALRDILRRAREYVEPGDLADRIAEALGEARPEATERDLTETCPDCGARWRFTTQPAIGHVFVHEPGCPKAGLLWDAAPATEASVLEAAIRRECERVGIPAPGEWREDGWGDDVRMWPPPVDATAIVVITTLASERGWSAWEPALRDRSPVLIARGPETGEAGRSLGLRALLTWLRAQPDRGAP